jgi:predicted CXXCH cytochrome family protein
VATGRLLRSALVIQVLLLIFTAISLPGGVSAAELFTHQPYLTKLCNTCHQLEANGSPMTQAFVKEQPELCYQCHGRKDGAKIIHDGFKMSKCTDCHDPHQSEVKRLLRSPVSELCTQCHEAPGMKFGVKHPVLLTEKSCTNCHLPHSSDLPKLLKTDTKTLCLDCHTEVRNKLNEPKTKIHQALKQGCLTCHKTHGGKLRKLLTHKLNDLCYRCHNHRKFGKDHPEPDHPVENMRDPIYPEKLLSCISCHKPHASKHRKLFRYNYKVAPYDGTPCSVCHWKDSPPPPPPSVPKPKWDD